MLPEEPLICEWLSCQRPVGWQALAAGKPGNVCDPVVWCRSRPRATFPLQAECPGLKAGLTRHRVARIEWQTVPYSRCRGPALRLEKGGTTLSRDMEGSRSIPAGQDHSV